MKRPDAAGATSSVGDERRARRLPAERDARRVAAERGDLALNPLERGEHVEQAPVSESEAERAEAVAERDDHDLGRVGERVRRCPPRSRSSRS